MDKFEVGEVAILQNCKFAECNGSEVEIIGGLIEREAFDHDAGVVNVKPRYAAKGFDVFYPEPYKLRKKRPPREDVGDWSVIEDLTGWSPRKAFVPLLAERYGRG